MKLLFPFDSVELKIGTIITFDDISGDLSMNRVEGLNDALDEKASTEALQALAETTAQSLSEKMDKANPTGTGSFSLNRRANTTVGDKSVAVGSNTLASGNVAFAEGMQTEASGNYSHAEGFGTMAKGQGSHAEGMQSVAEKSCAHAEGYIAKANGSYSHAEGNNTIASHKSQHVFGEYNAEDSSEASATSRGNYVEIVGNGAGINERSNARTLDWDGNETLAGDLTYNGNKSITSEVARLDGRIDNLPVPVVFEGTLGTGGTIETLPAASAENEGYMYKVITAGTYQSIECKVGDALISNGSEWVLIPAGDTDTDTWRNIKVNGSEKFGNGISSGAVDFVDGKNTKVSYESSGKKIKVDLNVTEAEFTIPAGTEDMAFSKSGGFPDNAVYEFYTSPCIFFKSVSVSNSLIVVALPKQTVDVTVKVRIIV